MKTFFKHMLVALFILTTITVHANIFSTIAEKNIAATATANGLQNVGNYSDPLYQQENGSSSGFSGVGSGDLISDTTATANNFPARLKAARALVNFVAAANSNNFNLSWNTLPENSNDHFEVERSLDGSHFEKVGVVKGVDIASGKLFSFMDNASAATVRKNDFFYRLKEVDADGSCAYSKVLVARMFNSRNVYSISVTPDANINNILVNVQLKKSAYVVMKISDSKGNEILRKSANGDFGTNNYELTNTSNLEAGVYSLEIIVNSSERMNMQLIKD